MSSSDLRPDGWDSGKFEEEEDADTDGPWWRDRDVLLPLASGIAFLAGLVARTADAPEALVSGLFWIGLLSGAVTFVPGAVRAAVTRRKVGVSALMTISAVGSVLLGYVAEAAALAFLYSVAEMLEDKAMDRARGSLRALLSVVPETARVERAGGVVEIPTSHVALADRLVVRAGDRVATDGVVVEGRSALDTSAITGESIPVEVGPADRVMAGSVNTRGVLTIEATAPGHDNSLTHIVQLVEQAQARKGQRARLADRLARPLVPGVVALAVAVAVLGSVFGDPHVWVTRALVVLVAASPCALAIAVPITIISAVGAASRMGVIVTSGAAFEELGAVTQVALDKTGTLTRNAPAVVEVVTAEGVAPGAVLRWAGALERHSSHPVASAIAERTPDAPLARDIVEEPGRGIRGAVDGAEIRAGQPRWVNPGPLAAAVQRMEDQGATVVVVARAGRVCGAIAVRDEARPEAAQVVQALVDRGMTVTMLTGDNARAAAHVAQDVGIGRGGGSGDATIGQVRAELSPADKAAAVGELRQAGPTAMVGDGINDAPALATADVGIAVGASGSRAAMQAADIALTGHDLRTLVAAVDLARRGRTIIDQNLALSVLIIAALVPLAVTGALSLAAVVLIHESAEVVVILNGLRAARLPKNILR